MSITYPIKDCTALVEFKKYYLCRKSNYRNYALIVMGLNTALRISDILRLQWGDIFDLPKQDISTHLEIIEHKTGKISLIALNASIRQTFSAYYDFVFAQQPYQPDLYLFPSNKGKNQPLHRSQAFRIIKEAANASNLSSHISCHSLRKTFGYHAWRQGTPPALLMAIYNHSSYHITKHYLCIEQDERDEVFLKVTL